MRNDALSAENLKDLNDFVNTAQGHGNIPGAKGIYNLQPLQDLATKNLNQTLLGHIKLRMATVGLQTGAVRYVTEKGRLVDDPTKPSDDPNSPQVNIISGMLASAAIPAI